MQERKKVVVIMPAYNAEKTLERTYSEVVAHRCVDRVIIVDDRSSDRTFEIAMGLEKAIPLRHSKNLGYGANQKTCYRTALDLGADIVIMVHPDYQYTPKLVPAMASLVGSGLYDCVLASRILGGRACEGGMPRWKYVANRLLTGLQNLCFGVKLSEYHTGYRAYSSELLRSLNWQNYSDSFVFDNQLLSETIWRHRRIGEISCPAYYFPDASSIGLRKATEYGLGCLGLCVGYYSAKLGIVTRLCEPVYGVGDSSARNGAVVSNEEVGFRV